MNPENFLTSGLDLNNEKITSLNRNLQIFSQFRKEDAMLKSRIQCKSPQFYGQNTILWTPYIGYFIDVTNASDSNRSKVGRRNCKSRSDASKIEGFITETSLIVSLPKLSEN